MATEPLLKYGGIADNYQKRSYQEKVSSLNYAAVTTRPDIIYTAQKLSEHLLNPGPQHHKAADRCIAYLNSTKDLALEYSGTDDVVCKFEVGTDSA